MHIARLLIKYKLHYLFFWLLLFGLWYFLRSQDYSNPRTHFVVTLVKVVDLGLMVSICNYILIPKLLYTKRYFLFITLFVVMILVSSIGKMYLLGNLTNNLALLNWTSNWKGRVYDNVIPHFFLVLAGATIKLMIDYTRMQQRMIEMAKEKAEAELNFLKSQINPHFLFNSLNTVYFQIDKNNVEARDTLHRFSDMLRYQLYEMNGSRVPVEKEIRFLQDYVSLQKMRKDDQYVVNFFCDEKVKDFQIEPLLLMPLVENAFKHISHSSSKKNFVKLVMDRKNGAFHFIVENSTEPATQNRADHKGIGLSNVKRRLELLYPGKHSLHIAEMDGLFQVNLTIDV